MNRSHVALALVCAPILVAGSAWVVVLAWAAASSHPIWSLDPRNAAEAAAFRDGATMVRLIESGAGPRQPGEIRAGLIADEPIVLTPMDAAVAARRPELVQLLFDLGLSLDAASWVHAWCAGTDGDVRSLLREHRPEGAAEECTDEESLPVGPP
jgi:hypothetical protein